VDSLLKTRQFGLFRKTTPGVGLSLDGYRQAFFRQSRMTCRLPQVIWPAMQLCIDMALAGLTRVVAKPSLPLFALCRGPCAFVY